MAHPGTRPAGQTNGQTAAREYPPPIVFATVSDPVEEGLIKSFPQPGGNVTGVGTLNWELSGKRMQLLTEVMPTLRRVGVLITPSVFSSKGLKLVEDAAGANVEVVPALAKNVSELEAAFTLRGKARVEAVIISGVTLFLRERKRMLQLASGQRLPVAGP